jgi:hypothetical protein
MLDKQALEPKAVKQNTRAVKFIVTLVFATSIISQSSAGRSAAANRGVQSGQAVTFKIPQVKIPQTIKDQQVTIAVSALITLLTKQQSVNILKLELTADLEGLQQDMTQLLAAQLDKDDKGGDRIAIQNATLTPLDPAGLLVVQLHYERWACANVLGKQEVKRLITGNAVMQLELTPAIDDDRTTLRLVPGVVSVQADGSLGELLRSGALGDILREKIRNAVVSAMQKGTDLGATLPSAAQGHATIQNAQFRNGGSDRLMVILIGEIQITDDQLQALSKQVNDSLPAR